MQRINESFDECSRSMYPIAISSFLAAAKQFSWPLSERTQVKISRRIRDFNQLSDREVASILAGIAGVRDDVSLAILQPGVLHLCQRL